MFVVVVVVIIGDMFVVVVIVVICVCPYLATTTATATIISRCERAAEQLLYPRCPVCRNAVIGAARNHTLDGLIEGLLKAIQYFSMPRAPSAQYMAATAKQQRFCLHP